MSYQAKKDAEELYIQERSKKWVWKGSAIPTTGRAGKAQDSGEKGGGGGGRAGSSKVGKALHDTVTTDTWLYTSAKTHRAVQLKKRNPNVNYWL